MKPALKIGLALVSVAVVVTGVYFAIKIFSKPKDIAGAKGPRAEPGDTPHAPPPFAFPPGTAVGTTAVIIGPTGQPQTVVYDPAKATRGKG